MNRIWFNFAAAVSLLLGIAAVVLWVRSYWVGDTISYFRAIPATRQGSFFQVILSRGVFKLTHDREVPDSQIGFDLLTADQKQLGLDGLAHRSAPPVKLTLAKSGFSSGFHHVERTAFIGREWLTINGSSRSRAVEEGNESWDSSSVTFPAWAITAPLFLLGLPTVRRLRRRPLPGCCHACGYDLTGNTSGVCPECGTPC